MLSRNQILRFLQTNIHCQSDHHHRNPPLPQHSFHIWAVPRIHPTVDRMYHLETLHRFQHNHFLLNSQPNLVSRGNSVSHLCSLPHKAVLPRVRPSRRGGELFIFLTRLRSAKVRVLAAVCLLLLCFINCYSVKWATLVSQSLQGL